MYYFFWGALFGMIGIAYFMYGRKQSKTWPMIFGGLLIVFPYFISNMYVMLGIGVTLTVLPYFFRER